MSTPELKPCKTPRTDAFRRHRLRLTGTPVKDYLAEPEINFARTLESELADLRAKLDAARVAIAGMVDMFETVSKCVPWGKTFLHADAIRKMNEAPIAASAALAQIDTAISPPDTQSKNT